MNILNNSVVDKSSSVASKTTGESGELRCGPFKMSRNDLVSGGGLGGAIGTTTGRLLGNSFGWCLAEEFDRASKYDCLAGQFGSVARWLDGVRFNLVQCWH